VSEKKNPETTLWSMKEAAHELRVTDRTVWALLAKGKLPRTRIGRRVLIPREAVLAYVKRNTNQIKKDFQ
jgi:excisionase family DNA binding protein